MERLIKLVEKRKEVGERPAHCNGGNLNDRLEYERLGNLMIEEVERLYEEGQLSRRNG